MSAHNPVYTRVSGFGLAIVPFAPFRMAQDVAGPNALDVSYFAEEGELFARILADGTGGYRSKVDQNTRSLYDVVEISASDRLASWRVETSAFCCDWPAFYDLVSTRFPHEAAIVDFAGANGEEIYIQSAQQTPPLRKMAAPGQRVIKLDERTGIIDLQYAHEGQVWRQRHQYAPFPVHPLVVTVQAPRARFDQACIAARNVCESIAVFPEAAG